jgi:ankyrin repeat protein
MRFVAGSPSGRRRAGRPRVDASRRPFGPLLGALCLYGAGLCATLLGAADLTRDDLNSSLMYAARQGDRVAYAAALKLGANPRATDRRGNNAAVMAAQGGQHEMLRMVLDAGADPNARGASGLTPLAYAALRGSVRDVRLLLKFGADPDQRTATGDTALHLAVWMEKNDALRELVKAGASVDLIGSQGQPPLVLAIRQGNAQGFATLLDARANVNSYDRARRSALFWAILENQEAMALELLERGAWYEAPSDGYTPLRMARIMGQRQLVAALAQRGASD